ncbi:CU044_2847 family protein [Anabaena azotica]|uniref:CU044_2847 family protein n=1 Tax=Anabaena azotica TaxID=197653 RepID=UPI0039A6E84A
MAEKVLVPFTLDGGTILVEVEAPEKPKEGKQRYADSPSKNVANKITEAKQTFAEAIQQIKPVVTTIADQFKDLNTKEMEVKFGVKLSTEAGVILTSVGGEVNFEITVKWSKEEGLKEQSS